MSLPNFVKLVEVSPRDGLQDEAKIVPPEVKIELINRLNETGLRVIETTSFVSKHKIPQLADNKIVFKTMQKKDGVQYPVLVPNLHGFQDAQAAGVKHIAVFTAASETFTNKNINCSINESFSRIAELMNVAKKNNIPVRAYISCALGCPYEGKIEPHKVAQIAKKLYEMGCSELALSDTIGIATPKQTTQLLQQVFKIDIPLDAIAVHFHDTYGQAIANIYAALQLGVHIIDSSVAGLGGCPYAKGATGNVASEDVLYLLNGLAISTGVDLNKLISVGNFISHYLGQPSRSNVARAIGDGYI